MKRFLLIIAALLFSVASFAQIEIIDRTQFPFYQYPVDYVDGIKFTSRGYATTLTFKMSFYARTFDVSEFSELAAVTLVNAQEILAYNENYVYVWISGYERLFALSRYSFRNIPEYVYVYNPYGVRYHYRFRRHIHPPFYAPRHHRPNHHHGIDKPTPPRNRVHHASPERRHEPMNHNNHSNHDMRPAERPAQRPQMHQQTHQHSSPARSANSPRHSNGGGSSGRRR